MDVLRFVVVTTDTAAALAQVRHRAPREGRKTREDAGLSLAEVARSVGVSAPTIFRWEHGYAAPHGSAALRYLAVLDQLAVR